IFFCWFLAAKPPKTNKKRGLGRSPSDVASALVMNRRCRFVCSVEIASEASDFNRTDKAV
ncbi:MAG: hypothetical protein WCJ55_04255, partial [Chloroflexales bacterium]